MIKEYTISILVDGLVGGETKPHYFAGESDVSTIEIPVACWSKNGFQVERKNAANLIFTDRPEDAKRIVGRINLIGYLNRILEQLPYVTVKILEIRIQEVDRDES